MSGSHSPAFTSSSRCKSVWHTPAARTWTTTSSGPDCGFGNWTNFTDPSASNRIVRTDLLTETRENTICIVWMRELRTTSVCFTHLIVLEIIVDAGDSQRGKWIRERA